MEKFSQEFQKLPNVALIIKWLEVYFSDEVGEHLNFRASTVNSLFIELEASSAFNYLNPRMLDFLAIKLGFKCLNDSVRHYEERFLNRKMQDLILIDDLKIVGKYITSKKVAESVAASLVQQEITIRQLQHMCTLRLLNNAVTLDCGSHSPSFYLSYKVIT